MARIDMKQLVEQIKEFEGERVQVKTNKTSNGSYENYYKDDLTELYSFRAHLRGRLHMTKREMNKYYVPKGAKVLEERPHAFLVEWTMADQEKLVASCWERFKLEEDEVQVQIVSSI